MNLETQGTQYKHRKNETQETLYSEKDAYMPAYVYMLTMVVSGENKVDQTF